MTPTPEQSAIEELEARLIANSHWVGDCLIWLGYQDKDGYGHVRWNGTLWLVHRAGFMCHSGRIPKLNVLHRCDNPSCWAEAHLFEGTQQDNIDDMIAKGRDNLLNPQKGTDNGHARLSEENVREIRRLIEEGYSQRFIANQFNVAQSLITHINKGRIWTHVT